MVRDFYTRCIGYCIEEECLEEIMEVIEAMFVISESPTMNENSICEKKKNAMKEKFKTFERKHKRDPFSSDNKTDDKNVKQPAVDNNDSQEIDMEDFSNCDDDIYSFMN